MSKDSNGIKVPDFGIIIRNEEYIFHMMDSLFAATSNYKLMFKGSVICGCYYCFTKYKTKTVQRFNRGNERNSEIICPKCKRNTLITDTSGYKIRKALLIAINEYINSDYNAIGKLLDPSIFSGEIN